MATRVIPPRILKNIRYNTVTATAATKPLNSAHPSIISSAAVTQPSLYDKADQKPPSTAVQPPSLNLDDPEKLFSSVSTSKLLRSSAVLHATAMEPMVDFGMWIMKSKLVQKGVLKDLVMASVKKTFYE